MTKLKNDVRTVKVLRAQIVADSSEASYYQGEDRYDKVKVWPMDPDLKKKWVKALRSGKYKQVDGTLKAWDEGNRNYGFCCLGVLCDIYNPDAWVDGDGTYNLGGYAIATYGWAVQDETVIVDEDYGFDNSQLEASRILPINSGSINPVLYDERVTIDEWCDDEENKCYREEVVVIQGSLPVWLLAEAMISKDAENYLINLNDAGASFDQIADFIEEYL